MLIFTVAKSKPAKRALRVWPYQQRSTTMPNHRQPFTCRFYRAHQWPVLKRPTTRQQLTAVVGVAGCTAKLISLGRKLAGRIVRKSHNPCQRIRNRRISVQGVVSVGGCVGQRIGQQRDPQVHPQPQNLSQRGLGLKLIWHGHRSIASVPRPTCWPCLWKVESTTILNEPFTLLASKQCHTNQGHTRQADRVVDGVLCAIRLVHSA